MIKIHTLTKRFGSLVAVDGISFECTAGEVIGLLGPNGAGKSTTMKMITGFITPSSGQILVAGYDMAIDSLEARKQIGYLPEGAPSYADMTPRDQLNFVAQVRGMQGEFLETRMAEVIDTLHLEPVLDQSIDTLSKGFKRRVAFAQAILHDPDILILDEPTDGLDPNQKHEVRALIKSMSADKLIFISTHLLDEVEAICSRVLIIADGKILRDATPMELLTESDTGRLDEVFRRITRGKAA